MVGVTIGPYRVLEKLGEGGMGEVYRARDMKLGRDVAIKILPGNFADDPERIARFQREAQVLAALNHQQSRNCTASRTAPLERDRAYVRS